MNNQRALILQLMPATLLVLGLILCAPEAMSAQGEGARFEASVEEKRPSAGAPSTASKGVLRVATKTLKPFSFQEADGTWSGFSIELWGHIAERMGVETEFVEAQSVRELLKSVEEGKVDLGIAGITVTSERERTVDFSHSLYDAGLQVMTNTEQESGGVLSVLLGLITSDLGQLLGLLVVVLVISGHLIWLAERKQEDTRFATSYLPEVWDGFWWAAVTLTTVGYGDRVPRGVIGRVIGVLWMFAGLFLVSYFTASVTSALTVQSLEGRIKGPEDLPGLSVAAPAGTTAADYVPSVGAIVSEAHERECYRMLQAGEVEAMVHDAPVLQYFARHEGKGKVQVSGPVFQKEKYAIALPNGSAQKEQINLLLLNLSEDGTYAEVHRRWFGASHELGRVHCARSHGASG